MPILWMSPDSTDIRASQWPGVCLCNGSIGSLTLFLSVVVTWYTMRGLVPPGADRNRVNAAFMPCVQRNGFQISYIWYLKIWNNFIKVNGSCECKLSGLLLCAVQGSSSFTLYFGDPSMHWRGNTTHSQLASRPDAFDASTSACSILPKYRVGILIGLIVKIFLQTK